MSDIDPGDQPDDDADVKPDDAEHQDDQPDQPDTAAELAAATERADKLARDLFAARVAATGKLADATDMPFDAALVDDADKLSEAIDALVKVKPHLASRRPVWGDVGAGEADAKPAGGPTFADLLTR